MFDLHALNQESFDTPAVTHQLLCAKDAAEVSPALEWVSSVSTKAHGARGRFFWRILGRPNDRRNRTKQNVDFLILVLSSLTPGLIVQNVDPPEQNDDKLENKVEDAELQRNIHAFSAIAIRLKQCSVFCLLSAQITLRLLISESRPQLFCWRWMKLRWNNV